MKLLQFNSIVLTKKAWDCLYGIVEQFTEVTKPNARHNTNYVILAHHPKEIFKKLEIGIASVQLDSFD